MNAQEHLTRILADLSFYETSNKRPAIDEPGNDFEVVVNAHDQLAALLAELKKTMKPLETEERTMRDGIAESLIKFFGAKLNDGVNNYLLTNLRKLKYTHKVKRSIEDSMIAVARAKFEAASDKVGAFDDVLRVKHELDTKAWKKLAAGGEAFKACSEMIVAKTEAPVLEID